MDNCSLEIQMEHLEAADSSSGSQTITWALGYLLNSTIMD